MATNPRRPGVAKSATIWTPPPSFNITDTIKNTGIGNKVIGNDTGGYKPVSFNTADPQDTGDTNEMRHQTPIMRAAQLKRHGRYGNK